MPWLCDDALWDGFATRALFHAAYGGADVGECREAVARFRGGGPRPRARAVTAKAPPGGSLHQRCFDWLDDTLR